MTRSTIAAAGETPLGVIGALTAAQEVRVDELTRWHRAPVRVHVARSGVAELTTATTILVVAACGRIITRVPTDPWALVGPRS